MRAAARAREVRGVAAGQGVRALRRRQRVDVPAHAGDRAAHGRGVAVARRVAGRERSRLAAERAGRDPGLVRAELPRRGLRPDQPCVPGPHPRARDPAVGSAAADRARGAGRAPARHRPVEPGRAGGAGRRGREDRRHEAPRRRRARSRGRRAAPAGAADPALGPAVDHLHVGHHRAVQGRDVLVSARRDHVAGDGLPARGRPAAGDPAAVPRRRDGRGLRDAAARRVDRRGRRLSGRCLLGRHRRSPRDLRRAARRHGHAAQQARAVAGRSRARAARRDHGAAARRRPGVLAPLRLRDLHGVQHDRDLVADRVRAQPTSCAAPAGASAPGSRCAWSTTTTARSRRARSAS